MCKSENSFDNYYSDIGFKYETHGGKIRTSKPFRHTILPQGENHPFYLHMHWPLIYSSLHGHLLHLCLSSYIQLYYVTTV